MSGAMALSAEAGWNQTAADWRIMLELGAGHGLTTVEGDLVGTAVSLPYGPDFGWISMVLVTGRWRRQGLATALLKRCIADLEDKGLMAGLDATPDGARVYRQHGFATGFPFTRWQRTAPLTTGAAAMPVSDVLGPTDLAVVAERDAAAAGCDRRLLLAQLLERGGRAARILPAGVLLSRDGRLARQIGPILADSETVACTLLRDALAEVADPVFIDVPDAHTAIRSILTEQGFSQQRSFVRMMRGPGHSRLAEPGQVYALAGPEFA